MPPVPGLDAAQSRLARAIGVTRVARLTGLDRAGLEVASAIRPDGHVLQVTNGKGATFADAARGALSEAAELWASEQLPLVSAFGSANEVHALTGLAPWSEGPWRRGWVLGHTLAGGQVLLPVEQVSCLPLERSVPGVPIEQWTSNGLGAHPTRAGALRHALLEAWEREALCRTLPDGWLVDAVRARRRDAGATGRALEARGFRVAVFDLSPDPRSPPVAGALLAFDEGPVRLTAGYAARERFEDAAEAALLEAVQSRLTEIHGAREDVVAQRRTDAAISPFFQLPVRRGRSTKASIDAFGRRLASRVAVVELAKERLPVTVLRVVVNGFRVSELLQ